MAEHVCNIVEYTCRKEGLNKGRKFEKCQGCSRFEWKTPILKKARHETAKSSVVVNNDDEQQMSFFMGPPRSPPPPIAITIQEKHQIPEVDISKTLSNFFSFVSDHALPISLPSAREILLQGILIHKKVMRGEQCIKEPAILGICSDDGDITFRGAIKYALDNTPVYVWNDSTRKEVTEIEWKDIHSATVCTGALMCKLSPGLSLKELPIFKQPSIIMNTPNLISK